VLLRQTEASLKRLVHEVVPAFVRRFACSASHSVAAALPLSGLLWTAIALGVRSQIGGQYTVAEVIHRFLVDRGAPCPIAPRRKSQPDARAQSSDGHAPPATPGRDMQSTWRTGRSASSG
jgi:hypothetical protein